MSDVDHAIEARGAIDKARSWISESQNEPRWREMAQLLTDRAQAHATLAVAYELRTANLLAHLHQPRKIDADGLPREHVERIIAHLVDVEKRLGLHHHDDTKEN